MFKNTIIILLLLFGSCLVDAQVLPEAILQSKDTVKSKEINPLSPAKAAFFSAVLPGMGQAYNKKYWKIPLVYGAMGTSMYYYNWNNKKYHDFRDAYKSRLAGFNNDQYQFLDDSRLVAAQRFYQRNRDMSLLLTVAFYILNIVDANIDSHLLQFNVNDNLSLNPKMEQNDLNFRTTFGLALNITLK